MNVIFTCGGTGGHINPAIAVANIWRKRHPDSKILFIGAKGHMEEHLVPKAGFDLECLEIAGLSRGKNLKAIQKNLKTVSNTVKAVKECKKIIARFQPDVILGTGGYACFPALMAGTMMGIPTCIHESNAIPGLTTKLLADRVDKALIAFADSACRYRHPEKVEAVGMPVREEFIYLDKQTARKELGLGDGPVVVSAFGSLGAKKMNEVVAELLKIEKDNGYPFHHIHATGKFGWEWMPDQVSGLGVNWQENDKLDMREYIYNMPQVMAAADVIISRAGASSCNEIAAAGTPCILIPSPNVAANHQEKNARLLSDKGGAVLVLESECTAQKLYDTIMELLSNERKRETMKQALHGFVVLNSADRICDIMEQLIKETNR